MFAARIAIESGGHSIARKMADLDDHADEINPCSYNCSQLTTTRSGVQALEDGGTSTIMIGED